jgi:hypothetical protein
LRFFELALLLTKLRSFDVAENLSIDIFTGDFVARLLVSDNDIVRAGILRRDNASVATSVCDSFT